MAAVFAVSALTACPGRVAPSLAAATADHPLVVSGGVAKAASGAAVRWNILAYTAANKDVCLEFRIEQPRSTSSYCAARAVVETALAKEKMTPQVVYSDTSSWVFGWSASDVARVEVWVSKTLVAQAMRTTVRGAPYRAFWVQVSPRLKSVPEAVAVDTAGHVVARDASPDTGGCAGCVPKAAA